MVNEKIKLDFVPDKKILRTISKTGSSFKDSFSEMIDNSLDSFKSTEDKLSNEHVTVSIQFATSGQEGVFRYKNKEGEDYDIELWDDAGGMDKEEFKKCLKLAYVDEKKIKKGSIRRYGVGLKTSLLSLGKKFKIMTRPIGSKNIYSLVYDDDNFVNDKDMDWDSLFFTVEEDDPNFPEHGTIIKIKKRDDLKIYPAKISQMRSYFRVQYTQFLEERGDSKKELNLIINKDKVKAHPLELISFKDIKKHPFSFKLSSGKLIKGWYGFYRKGAKHGQVKGNFGFDLIWQRRIIKRYSKIGIRTHPEHQRIYGEIHLDELDVDFHKTAFIKDSKDYVDFAFNMEYFLNGPDYEDAIGYFDSGEKSIKPSAQLDVEVKQFDPLFEFLNFVKRSRIIRNKLNTIIFSELSGEDKLPIPLEKLRDLRNKLYEEMVPLDNIPAQEKIVADVEKNLVEQRKKREEEKRKEQEAKQNEEQKASTGSETAKKEEKWKEIQEQEIIFIINKDFTTINVFNKNKNKSIKITKEDGEIYSSILKLIEEINVKID